MLVRDGAGLEEELHTISIAFRVERKIPLPASKDDAVRFQCDSPFPRGDYASTQL